MKPLTSVTHGVSYIHSEHESKIKIVILRHFKFDQEHLAVFINYIYMLELLVIVMHITNI